MTPLFQPIRNLTIEMWPGSPVIRERKSTYQRWPSELYKDAPASLTLRQIVFYKNLMALALALGSTRLPVDFGIEGVGDYWMDHGCIKIAEHAGFIRPLENEEDGLVGSIELAWRVTVD
ncbi:MAG: hypothetical protein WBG82_01725 [Parvibaculum sp.]|uniref:hypothetical protein n=1 Tax=Parvibaculum sp. TaxID=2024848 RepID=UPI003C78E2A0